MKKYIVLSVSLILSLDARDNPFASVDTNALPTIQTKQKTTIDQKKPKEVILPSIKNTPVTESVNKPEKKWDKPIDKPIVKNTVITPIEEQSSQTVINDTPITNIDPKKDNIVITKEQPIETKHTVEPIVYPYDPNDVIFLEDQEKIKKQKTSYTNKVNTTTKQSISSSTVYSNNFVKIKIENDEVKIITKDPLLKKFILPMPLRYSLDIKRDQIKFPSKIIKVDSDIAKTIKIGAHIDFYRISIELNKHKNAHLIKTNYGFLITFK